MTGASGSCTWRTSKRSRSKIRFIRGIACGDRTMFESEALAGTITVRPTGRT